MGRLQKSPTKNKLARKSGGGVISAAEKRRRMIEAGKRFALKSVHRMSPARLAQSSILRSVVQSKSKSKSVSAKPSPFRSTDIPHTPRSGHLSCDEQFSKDENSLAEILNNKPISYSVGRPSQLTRLGRPSLFPNGVNPFDEGMVRLSSKKSVPPEKPPRTFVETLQNVNNQLENVIGSSASKKTPGKSVRFADSVMAETHAAEEKTKTWLELSNGFSDGELLQVIRLLPSESYRRLQHAINLLESEIRGRGAKRVLFTTCATINEAEDSPLEEKIMTVKSPEKKAFKTETTPIRPNKVEGSLDAIAIERSCASRVLTVAAMFEKSGVLPYSLRKSPSDASIETKTPSKEISSRPSPYNLRSASTTPRAAIIGQTLASEPLRKVPRESANQL